MTWQLQMLRRGYPDEGERSLIYEAALWANAARAAPRSHASHSARSGLRPTGFDRISQETDK